MANERDRLESDWLTQEVGQGLNLGLVVLSRGDRELWASLWQRHRESRAQRLRAERGQLLARWSLLMFTVEIESFVQRRGMEEVVAGTQEKLGRL